MMKYISTRGHETPLEGAAAIIQGIAPDKGLYVPEKLPKLPFNIEDKLEAGYKEIAKDILGTFFDDFTSEEIEFCVNSAYDDKFDCDEIVPVVKSADGYFLELYHGKTAAFKDMALSILPYLLTTAMKKEKKQKKVCILTATSGDTGKAALEGFADVKDTEIIVFFPNKGVSAIQERQMVTQTGNNTHVFAIEGNFDDAQRGVKEIFNDENLAENLDKLNWKLSSANSINIGRLVPQIVYYVYGYIKLVKRGIINCGDKINVSVPTGNFGNILAAFYAKNMGLPIDKLICASNENNVLTDFLKTGIYDANRKFFLTNSPSMDILISSNLERLLFHLSGNNAEEVVELMKNLEDHNKYQVSEKIRLGLSDFFGGFADVSQTNETIRNLYKEYNYLADTHTSVAYKVYEDYKSYTMDCKPTLISSTASPYKFAESVSASIGLEKGNDGFECIDEIYRETKVPIPVDLKNLQSKPIIHKDIISIKGMKDKVIDSLR